MLLVPTSQGPVASSHRVPNLDNWDPFSVDLTFLVRIQTLHRTCPEGGARAVLCNVSPLLLKITPWDLYSSHSSSPGCIALQLGDKPVHTKFCRLGQSGICDAGTPHHQISSDICTWGSSIPSGMLSCSPAHCNAPQLPASSHSCGTGSLCWG